MDSRLLESALFFARLLGDFVRVLLKVMKILIFALLLANSTLWGGAQVPGMQNLGSESFLERSEVLSSLELWVMEDQKQAKKLLLREYLRCDDPEIRVRLLALLERSYFPIRGYVGITMRSTLWDQFGRLQKDEDQLGVRVTEVGKGTPAELSGLRGDDIILKINEWEVKGDSDVTAKVAAEIQKYSPGTSIALEVLRGEKRFVLSLKLGVLPVPSERARALRAGNGSLGGVLPGSLLAEIKEFQNWLVEKIEKDRKNLIADRRL